MSFRSIHDDYLNPDRHDPALWREPVMFEAIRSKKHPGAVFVKIKGTRSDFLCKIYPEHEAEAEAIIEALTELYNS